MSKNLMYVTIVICCLVILVSEGIIAMPKVAYPGKPINFIVPVGSCAGFRANALESGFTEEFNQPLVILRRAGGGGTDAWNELVRARADGYTVGISNPELILHTLYKTGSYHYLTALEPLAQVAVFPYLLVVDAESPWRTVEELVAYGKAYPGQIKYGHRGIGSMSHMMGAAFGKAAAFSAKAMPFKNVAESVRALHGGHIQMMFAAPSLVKEGVTKGRLRVLAITGEKKMKENMFAAVPTLRESGIDLVFEGWIGIVAPQEMAADAKQKLKRTIQKIVNEPGVANDLQGWNMEVSYLDTTESRKKWLKEYYSMKEKLEGTGILEELKARQAHR